MKCFPPENLQLKLRTEIGVNSHIKGVSLNDNKKAKYLIKFIDLCDLKKLNKPKNADQWICDKSITNDKVPTFTQCKIACKDGFDFHKGNATF